MSNHFLFSLAKINYFTSEGFERKKDLLRLSESDIPCRWALSNRRKGRRSQPAHRRYSSLYHLLTRRYLHKAPPLTRPAALTKLSAPQDLAPETSDSLTTRPPAHSLTRIRPTPFKLRQNSLLNENTGSTSSGEIWNRIQIKSIEAIHFCFPVRRSIAVRS
jgi:hypothetical protein